MASIREHAKLLNPIPDRLLSSFHPVYVEEYNQNNVRRLVTHQITIAEFWINPAKFTNPFP